MDTNQRPLTRQEEDALKVRTLEALRKADRVKEGKQVTTEEVEAMADVRRCLEIAPSVSGFYYLIETTYATFPRFVVGERRASDGKVKILLRCGLEKSAREYWQRLNPIVEAAKGPAEQIRLAMLSEALTRVQELIKEEKGK